MLARRFQQTVVRDIPSDPVTPRPNETISSASSMFVMQTYHRRHVGPRIPQFGIGVEDDLGQVGQDVAGSSKRQSGFRTLCEITPGGAHTICNSPGSPWAPIQQQGTWPYGSPRPLPP